MTLPLRWRATGPAIHLGKRTFREKRAEVSFAAQATVFSPGNEMLSEPAGVSGDHDQRD